MFALFRFDLPDAVTKELLVRLEQLTSSNLTPTALRDLSTFQNHHEIQHGVYLLLKDGIPAYIGKANDVAERLSQHLEKLRGRRNIEMASLGFKALILEVSWSTSANEELLIEHFKAIKQCAWNKTGFGPKDPGKNRDGHEPGEFDELYPINENWPCTDIANSVTVAGLLDALKSQLPYLLRYQIDKKSGGKVIDTRNVARTADSLLLHVAKFLGPDWQLMRFKGYYTFYKPAHIKDYEHGKQLNP